MLEKRSSVVNMIADFLPGTAEKLKTAYIKVVQFVNYYNFQI